MPFFGNSIASRIPLAATGQPTATMAPAAGSSAALIAGTNGSSSISGGGFCWPDLFGSSSKGSSSGKAPASGDILVLGDFRAAQRVCLRLKLSQRLANMQQQQELNAVQDEGATRSSDSSHGAGSQHVQQQQQQQQPRQQDDRCAEVWLVNTHLDHATAEIRAKQMQVGACEALSVLQVTLAARSGWHQCRQQQLVPISLWHGRGTHAQFDDTDQLTCPPSIALPPRLPLGHL